MSEIRRILEFLFDSEPSDVEEGAARARLEAHIAAEQRSPESSAAIPGRPVTADRPPPTPSFKPGSGVRFRLGWVGAALVSGLVLVSAFVLVRVLSPEPVSGLVELAEVTRLLPDEEFGDAALTRERTESVLVVEPASDEPDSEVVAYLLPRQVTERHDTEGLIQIETVNQATIFFDDTIESRFGDTIRERVRPGETAIETTTSPSEPDLTRLLTDNPNQLEARLRAQVERLGDPEVPDEAEILELAANIHRLLAPTPGQRAAILDVIARLDLITTVSIDDGVAVSITHSGRGTPERYTIGFGPTGWLASEELILLEGIPEVGVPPGTAIQTSRYQPPISVDG